MAEFKDPDFVRILKLEPVRGTNGIYIKRVDGKINKLVEIHGYNLPISALLFSPLTQRISSNKLSYLGEEVEVT